MSYYHQWKRRLWGGDYPFENGPPYEDPATGAPMLPGGAQLGPKNGLDDAVAGVPGNSITITFTGTLTADTQVSCIIWYDAAGNPGTGPQGKEWAGGQAIFPAGTTAADVATRIAAEINAPEPRNLSANAVGGVITVSLSSAGTIDGVSVVYLDAQAPSAGATSVDTITGPHSSPHGPDWYDVITSTGVWYWAVDIDADPEPDVKVLMDEFLANPNADAEYREDVQDQAVSEGYTP